MFEEPKAQYNITPKRMTLEEYWEFEYKSEGRHEYHDGVLIDMTYTSEPHGQICSNLTALISNCIREKDCSVYSETRMVFIPECNKNFYPDVVIVCDEHDLKAVSKNMRATMNPSVVIEVLSHSTEEFDKTTKIPCYKKIRNLNQIVYIWQDEKYVVVRNRTENDRIWEEIDYFEDEELVPIGDCLIPLNEIYRRVSFDVQSENATD
jgi:Uma2 family endonuclease